MTASPALGARAVLAIPDFRRIVAAQFISDFGDALTLLATLLMINQLTGSLAAIAFMAIVVAIPQVTIGPLAGVWVDRLEPRAVMLASDAIRAALVLGLILVRSADMVWLFFVLGFLEAAVSTFFTPARMTLVSVAVPRNGLLAANSLSQGGRVLATVLGTGAAGVLVSLADSGWPAFAVDSATFAISFLLILRVRARRPVSAAAATTEGGPARPSVIGELRAGIAAVTTSPSLVATLVAGSAVMLGIGAVNVLFVPLLVNDLGVSPAWFGAIDAAQTAGMLLAAAVLAARLAGVAPSRIIWIGMVGLSLFVGLLTGVTQVWQIVVLLFLVGWIVTPLQASVATIVQTETAPEVRGRVAALLNSSVTAANILSMAFAGVVGAIVGVRSVFVLSALVVGLGAVAALLLFRRAGRSRDVHVDTDSPAMHVTAAGAAE
jgi:MFS transporter, DHA3 family, macrolide efflux protein